MLLMNENHHKGVTIVCHTSVTNLLLPAAATDVDNDSVYR